MTNYFEVDAYSASAIKAGAVSMLNMHCFMERGIKASASMNKGTLMHMAILEPEKLDKLIVNDLNRNTKAFKELAAEHGKENIIKSAEMNSLIEAQNQLKLHAAKELFVGGKAEVEKYWVWQKLSCKCKIDYETDEYIVEYKTTANIHSFLKTCANLHYKLQLAWYWWGCGKKDVYVVAQEQSAPYDVRYMQVPTLMLERWLDEAQNIVLKYEDHKQANYFPGAYPTLERFELPAWAEDEIELDAESTIQF